MPGGSPNRFIDRFWAKINQTETCWLWTGTLDDHGYGDGWPVVLRAIADAAENQAQDNAA